jgi:hypothetical protein
MKNLLYFSAAIALSLLAAPRAHADTYTINFQPNPDSGLVGPIGSFSYDASAAVGQQFSNFTVTLTGDNVDVLNFTASANSGFTSPSGAIPGCAFSTTFQYLTQDGSCYAFTFDYQATYSHSGQGNYQANSDGFFAVGATNLTPLDISGPHGNVLTNTTNEPDKFAYNGDFTVTDTTPPLTPPASTPEPSGLILLATGLAGCAGTALRRMRRKA